MSTTTQQITVRHAGYFISGGINTATQIHTREPIVNTILTDHKGLQWTITRIAYDSNVKEKAKAAGFENVIIIALAGINHNNLPENNTVLHFSIEK